MGGDAVTATYAESMVTLCKANNPLMAVLTGGIYNYEDTGRKGMNRVVLPFAYNEQTGLVAPVAIFLELDETADNQAVDAAGYQTTQTPVLCWVYDSGNNGFGTVRTASQSIIKLLNFQQIPGAFQVIYQSVLQNKREPALNDASYYRLKFNVQGFRNTMT